MTVNIHQDLPFVTAITEMHKLAWQCQQKFACENPGCISGAVVESVLCFMRNIRIYRKYSDLPSAFKIL